MGLWTAVDTQVWSGTFTGSAEELDLSATVGANVALCLFGIELEAAGIYFQMRRKGASYLQAFVDSYTHGFQYVRGGNIGSTVYRAILCTTDSSGVLEFRGQAGSYDGTLKLLGYCVLSTPGVVQIITAATIPDVTWTAKDISAQHGAGVGYGFFEYSGGAWAGPTVALKKTGDTRTTEYTADLVQGGVNRGNYGQNAPNSLAVEIDASGVYYHFADGIIGDPTLNVWWLGSEKDNYTSVDEVIQDEILLQDDWNEINVSAHVAARSLCILKIEKGASGSQDILIAARRHGETDDYSGLSTASGCMVHSVNAAGRAGDILVECDADGKIDIFSDYAATPDTSVKITLVGYISGDAGPLPPSGAAYRSSKGSPRGMSGPSPITADLAAAGYLYREEFLTRALAARNDTVLTGSPTVRYGLILNGSSQYASLSVDDAGQHFVAKPHFWEIGFNPDFAANDGSEHVLFECEDPENDDVIVYGVRKLSSGVLRITLPDTQLDVALVTYQAEWVVGSELRLAVSASATPEAWLGATKILDAGATAWTAQGVRSVIVGADIDGANLFDGIIRYLRFGLGELAYPRIRNDQSTLYATSLSIACPAGAGNAVTVYWGDGTSSALVCDGALKTLTHNYTATGQYEISVVGDVQAITDFRCYNQSHISGAIDDVMAGLVGIEYIDVSYTAVSGNIRTFDSYSSLNAVYAQASSISQHKSAFYRADTLDKVLETLLPGGLSNAWIKSLWTSRGGTVVGPALADVGAPVTGHHTPWDDYAGTEITATRMAASGSYVKTATSVDPSAGEDGVMLILFRRRTTAARYIIGTSSSVNIAGFRIYTLTAPNDVYFFCTVSDGTTTRERVIADPNGPGPWNLIVLRAIAGGNVSYRINGTTGAADLATPANVMGSGGGLAVGALTNGIPHDVDVACAAFLAGTGLGAWWTDAKDAEIAGRLMGLGLAAGGTTQAFTRASIAQVCRPDGRRHFVGTGMPRGGHSGGLEFEPAATANKARPCIAADWTATGGLTPTDQADSAALVSAGVEAMRPDSSVVELINTTGAVQYLYCGDATGSTARHSLACLARMVAGTTKLGIYDPSTTDWDMLGKNIDDDYALTRAENIEPSTAGGQFALQVGIGATVRIAAAHIQAGTALSQMAPVPALVAGAGYTAVAETLPTPKAYATPGAKKHARVDTVKTRQIWLCAGQSNMRGIMLAASLPAAYTVPDSDIEMYLASPDEAYESAAVEAIDDGGTYIGPWLPFALDLKDLGRDVAVGVVAKGSTSLAVDWADGSALRTKLFEVAAAIVAGATAPATLAGFVWNQGESDGTDAGWAAAYEANLTAFFAAVRAVYPGLPIKVVQLNSRFGYAHNATVRTAQQAVVAADSLCELVDVDDLHIDAGSAHLSDGAVLQLGHRLAVIAARDEP